MKLTFGDIVVVEDNLIGVVVKCWLGNPNNKSKKKNHYEVYVRSWNCISEYDEDQVDRYMVRHKELSDEELIYQSETK